MTCRFCQRPWSPKGGVGSTDGYCPACAPQRRALARQDFEADGKVSVVRGKWLLRVAPSAVLPTDEVRTPTPRDVIQCRCGELRQAHAKGWRFGTCEDGEPHWQCPECVKQGTEPQPT